LYIHENEVKPPVLPRRYSLLSDVNHHDAKVFVEVADNAFVTKEHRRLAT